METILQDVRYGVRMLLKNPGFTLVAIVALTLGIGANSAIFSVVNSVLLRPLPYEDSARLMFLSEREPELEGMSISYPNFLDWREQNKVFEHISVYRRSSFNLTGVSEPERLIGGLVSADLFPELRVKAALGRTFYAEEDKPGGDPVVILSDGLWKRRFGSDPGILGRVLTLNDKPYAVAGVMPPTFQFPSRVEFWTPVGPESGSESWKQRGNHPGLYGVARLKPGISLQQARVDMDTIAINLEKQYPGPNTGARVSITPLIEVIVGDVRPALLVLLAAVGFVLLIACANVANLLLARAAARQKEIAIRTALGAGRPRIIRQLLTESLLLALCGGVFGLAIAKWGVKLIVAISPASIPRALEIGLDWKVLAFTLSTAILTGILFGIVPAWHASRADLHDALKESGRSSSSGRRRQRFRSALVVGEVALAIVLLVGSGLLIRSFDRVLSVPPGFEPSHLLTLNIALPRLKYLTPEKRIAFYDQVIGGMQNLPGVTSAAGATGLPLGNNGNQTSFYVAGQPDPPPGHVPLTEVTIVTPGYFRTMGIPLKKGRFLTAQDRNERGFSDSSWIGASSVVIDEKFARQYWPNESPLGRQLTLGGHGPGSSVATIVGVAGRVKMDGLDQDSGRVQLYIPFAQVAPASLSLVARVAGDPLGIVAGVREEVRKADKDLPIFGVQTIEALRDASIAPRRMNMFLLGIFAGLALLLAGVGIYGVMAYSVTQRTHEIGIRLALGAGRRQVVKLVVSHGMLLTLSGVGIGLLAALGAMKLMQSLLFAVSATDPLTFTIIPVILVLVSLLACYIPARRATKVDPMVALRCE